MEGPWEKYQPQTTAPVAPPPVGPWEKYAPPAADFSDVTARIDSTAPPVSPPPSASGEPSTKGPWRRELELDTRSAMQGVAGLVGALGPDVFNHYILNPTPRAVGLEDQQAIPYHDMASHAADRLGLEKPQNARERVLSAVNEALSGTALTMGAGSLLEGAAQLPQAARVAGEFLTEAPVRQALSAAAGAGGAAIAHENGAGEWGQLAAGLAGGLAPSLAPSATATGVRAAIRGADAAPVQQRIEDFAHLGVSPSMGQAAGRQGVQGVESLLAGGPTSSGVMTRFAENQAEGIGAGLRKQADALSPGASAESAGRAIQSGAEQFKDATTRKKQALYQQVDAHIPANTSTPLPETWQAVSRLTSPTPGAAATTGALVHPRIAQLRQTLEQDLAAGGGAVPYEALKRIRTDIGESLGDYSLSSDVPTRELRQLYGALSRDMEAAATAAGPKAEQAARRANAYTRAVASRLEQLDRVVNKNGGPEAVFNAAMSGTRDGGTTLRAVMQSLPEDGQKALTAAVLKRMGLPTPGQASMGADQFSAATFLTNWNRLSPEARRALFDRYGPGFSQNMERIARVADSIKTGSKVFANPSGTANKAAAYTYSGAVIASLFTGGTGPLVAGGASTNLAARILTNPKAVRWLAKSTAVPSGSVLAGLGSLRNIAANEDDPDLKQLADDIAQAIPSGEATRATSRESK